MPERNEAVVRRLLEEVLNGSQDGNGGVRHHFVTSPADRANLIACLLSIDDATPIFP